MRRANMKRAQSWTIDYTIGLVLFLLALGIVADLLADTFQGKEYEELVDETLQLSENLLSPGYPQDWAEDVVQAGLLYDGRFSWRKYYEFANMNESKKRESFPTRNNYLITLRKNLTIQEIDEYCAVSNTDFPKSSNDTIRHFNTAYYSGGENELQTWANTNNATIYAADELKQLLHESHNYRLIIFEDANFTNNLNDSFTARTLREELEELASYGPRIILIGELGEVVFGASTNVSSAEGTISAHDEPFFNLNESDAINFTTGYDLSFPSEEEGALGNIGGAKRVQTISEGAALWQYGDSRIYYFSSAIGDYESQALKDVLTAGLEKARIRSTIECAIDETEINSLDMVSVERVVADRGETATLTITMWRNP